MDKYLNPAGVRALKAYIDEKDQELQNQIDAIGEPFRLYDFSQTIGVTLQPITGNNAPVDVDIAISDAMAVDWAIASLAKYEIYNGSNRLNAIYVASFSMSGQKILRCKMMTTGTESKWANKIQGALLLKHR